MKLSIQTIVFNAASTLPPGMLVKNIEQWLGVADEIIVVEGATRALRSYYDGDATPFTKDGKSTDGTRDILSRLADKHPQIKLILGGGWWDGKTSMCNAASAVATGDYLWQVDSDEFYHEHDIPKILKLLDDRKPDAVHFYAHHFFGDYRNEMGDYQSWGNGEPWRRIFRNTPHSQWISHEPPDYRLGDGTVCNKGRVITRDQTRAMGIRMYHYAYITKEQLLFKSIFYRKLILQWWCKWFMDHNVKILGASTSEYTGTHPAILQSIINGG